MFMPCRHSISLFITTGCGRGLGSSGATALDIMKPITAPMTMIAIRSARGRMSLVPTSVTMISF